MQHNKILIKIEIKKIVNVLHDKIEKLKTIAMQEENYRVCELIYEIREELKRLEEI